MLRPRKTSQIVLLKLCVTLVLVFWLHVLSLSYLSMSLANLTSTGLKRAFAGLSQPSAGSMCPGNEEGSSISSPALVIMTGIVSCHGGGHW